ncbi:hypothetical protein [Gordonia lacunae]|uniref:FUSC family protein n=1 Tax=Gordonia lacunae TaxID=417102 RepID=A0A243Q9E7_9ACTN|nr:hypothetical protein [Gordonia lacunae]OUC78369.1 hypothetical protein CA982_12840 [Gordonia lacunae]
MPKDSEPESRPISVSELLARSQGPEGDSPARSREGRGRRRAGRDGSFSVSALTGEIPRVTDADADSAPPEPPAPAAPAAQPTPATRPDTPARPEPAAPPARAGHPERPATPERDTTPQARPDTTGGPFPRSGSPIPRRPADDQPVVDRPRADRQQGRPGGRTASGMPGYGQGAVPPMATRDFSSEAVARRLGQTPPRDTAPVDRESANAVTGIIPVVGENGQDLSVVDSDDVVTYDLNEVDAGPGGPRERGDGGFSEVMDFDAYRNFADVEGAGDGPGSRDRSGAASRTSTAAKKPKTSGVGGLARKLFGGKKRERTEDERTVDEHRFDDPDQHAHDHDQYEPAGGEPTSDWAATAAAAATAGGTTAAIAAARPDVHPAHDDRTDDDHTDDDHTHDDRAESDPIADRSADDRTTDRRTDDHPTEAIAPVGSDHDDTGRVDLVKDEEQPRGSAEAGEPDEFVALHDTTDIDETPGAESGHPTPADDPARHGDPHAAGVAPAEHAEADDAPEVTAEEAEQSPVKAWLVLFGQAVVGLAVGVGLFWGFTELWRWNPYFALVLAVLVIFGIVTLSHVVRRTKDLPTTLLALGVGLLVTIGPLVLLAA